MKLKYNGYYPPEAEVLAQRRDELRAEGKFAEADELREKIKECGVEVVDTKTGYAFRWIDRNDPFSKSYFR